MKFEIGKVIYSYAVVSPFFMYAMLSSGNKYLAVISVLAFIFSNLYIPFMYKINEKSGYINFLDIEDAEKDDDYLVFYFIAILFLFLNTNFIYYCVVYLALWFLIYYYDLEYYNFFYKVFRYNMYRVRAKFAGNVIVISKVKPFFRKGEIMVIMPDSTHYLHKKIL